MLVLAIASCKCHLIKTCMHWFQQLLPIITCGKNTHTQTHEPTTKPHESARSRNDHVAPASSTQRREEKKKVNHFRCFLIMKIIIVPKFAVTGHMRYKLWKLQRLAHIIAWKFRYVPIKLIGPTSATHGSHAPVKMLDEYDRRKMVHKSRAWWCRWLDKWHQNETKN